jgi:hypothetical protein
MKQYNRLQRLHKELTRKRTVLYNKEGQFIDENKKVIPCHLCKVSPATKTESGGDRLCDFCYEADLNGEYDI